MFEEVYNDLPTNGNYHAGGRVIATIELSKTFVLVERHIFFEVSHPDASHPNATCHEDAMRRTRLVLENKREYASSLQK